MVRMAFALHCWAFWDWHGGWMDSFAPGCSWAWDRWGRRFSEDLLFFSEDLGICTERLLFLVLFCVFHSSEGRSEFGDG